MPKSRLLRSLILRVWVSLLIAPMPLCASGFGPVLVYPAGGGPSSAVVGFFNQDSYPDIAVANQFDNTISILLGNADGSFQQPVDYAVGVSPTAVSVGCEVLAGGPIVLAVTNAGSDSVSILLSNGDGTFQPAVNYATGTGTSPQGIAWSDFNRDDQCDLAIANASGGSNNSGNIAILIGKGDGTFQPATNFDSGGVQPVSLAVAPFLGGNIQDLAVVNRTSNNVSIFLNDGNAKFTLSANYPVGIAPSHVGLIGTDLFVTNSGSNSVTKLINSSGTFDHSKTFAVGTAPSSFTTGFFNRSHFLPGFAVTNQTDNTISVFLGKKAKPRFRKPVTFPTCSSPRSIVSADLNGDLLSDLVLACSNGVGVMVNSGP